jgi:hypothetical protein
VGDGAQVVAAIHKYFAATDAMQPRAAMEEKVVAAE